MIDVLASRRTRRSLIVLQACLSKTDLGIIFVVSSSALDWGCKVDCKACIGAIYCQHTGPMRSSLNINTHGKAYCDTFPTFAFDLGMGQLALPRH